MATRHDFLKIAKSIQDRGTSYNQYSLCSIPLLSLSFFLIPEKGSWKQRLLFAGKRSRIYSSQKTLWVLLTTGKRAKSGHFKVCNWLMLKYFKTSDKSLVSNHKDLLPLYPHFANQLGDCDERWVGREEKFHVYRTHCHAIKIRFISAICLFVL